MFKSLKVSIRNLLKERLFRYDSVYQEGINFSKNSCYPSGHFYSPISSLEQIAKNEDIIFKKPEDFIYGINLNLQGQLNLLNQLESYYKFFPYNESQSTNFRYHLDNDYFSSKDAVLLFCLLKHLNPKKIIEVGSGFSSALMLDTCTNTELTFIEPNPQRLISLLRPTDETASEILTKQIQRVELSRFKELNENDILFIDSSHISKTGSDVNFIIFEILPILKKGVLVHFHDVFYPFEYPKKWIVEGRNWNEDYILRAFLMYNEHFEIELFNHYLEVFNHQLFNPMPYCKTEQASSLWLRKL